jgi:hypothetical protein
MATARSYAEAHRDAELAHTLSASLARFRQEFARLQSNPDRRLPVQTY